MIRKAKIKDIKQIQELINTFAKQDVMLPRSLNELYENIRDFWVMEDKGKITACAALHIPWDDLAEIKSLAVAKNKQRKGIGKLLVDACIDEAKVLGAKKIFVLTYKPGYFKKFGFKRINHASLPHKIWAECINCCKFPNCQESALLKTL
ncbi:MAG: GNAT family N-acetyltransferase [Candidatus Omnitrophica bacterium CG08_land_8_20_14_0_20_41_16]|uniref:GNAT family N-acetyltransferase n=1 Tax=Candidatus Sherwoodlollariibacterium unditelluris TaxID=1974757 RepID=A0A2G9YL29_9BACT|nr:MAG: GNAT family N-acetyltransferase [Candidatus Omnitrophica bacterium CG23_combo_of_CG06-09_8_20_14_all_41_10]PIS34154.1 MAG: GNAT family N-acetyltransferase [Candidatus Omnitrophica bacterium CG08_land_8_20_14_0_20_41_16]